MPVPKKKKVKKPAAKSKSKKAKPSKAKNVEELKMPKGFPKVPKNFRKKEIKKEEPKKEEAIQPIATREVPRQVEREVPEIKEVERAAPSEQEPPAIKAAAEETLEEPEEIPEEKPKRKREDHGIIIGEAIEFGWNTVKSHLLFFIGIFLLFFALSFMIYGAGAIGTKVVLGILVLGMNLGYYKIGVDVVEKKPPLFKELFSCFGLLFYYLIARIIYTLLVAFGLLLFIIPGIIWAVKFGLYPYAMVKDRSGPIAALKKSSQLTENVKPRLIVLMLVLFGINLLGAIVLGIGMIVTIPLSIIAVAHIFKQLEKSS